MASPMYEPGVFGPDDLPRLVWFYDMNGYAILRGLIDDTRLALIEAECIDAQARVTTGDLDARYGSTAFLDDSSLDDSSPDDTEQSHAFAN